MPYIKQENRPEKDIVVEMMRSCGVSCEVDLQVLLFNYCKLHVEPSYNKYKNFIGELNECAAEIDRRGLYMDLSEKKELNVQELTKEDMAKIVNCMKECNVKADGDLNYILFKYCKECMSGEKIDYFADTLRITADKIRSELLSPYEDIKEKENGEV